MLGLALQTTLDAANKRVEALEAINAQLVAQRDLILALATNASDALVPVFGSLDHISTDEVANTLHIVTKDGLAQVIVNVATGKINIFDPRGIVTDIEVTLRPETGDLSATEITRIRQFRAEVLFSRQENNGYAGGPVSLVIKPKSTVTVESANQA